MKACSEKRGLSPIVVVVTSFATHLDTTTVAHLADMQGSGQVRDLREAANGDEWRVAA